MNNFFENIKHIYFIGIGGIGMSALAKYFNVNGFKVSGYDRTPSHITEQLTCEGIPVFYVDDPALLPDAIDLVIYTPAIPKAHKQLNYFVEKECLLKKRSEILGVITKDVYTIAVAGTHGKTTVSSIITHILKTADFDFMSFMGGIAKNYKSNFLSNKKNKIAVVEADEFDRSFLQLYPDIALISAMDADHLDIYGTLNNMVDAYNAFADQVKPQGQLILNTKTDVLINNSVNQRFNYSINDNTSYKASNIEIKNGAYHFDIIKPNNLIIENLQLNIGGRHNIENTVAAVAVCKTLGVDDALISKAISTYIGVERRFDVRINHKKLVYIDDYAHHPEELRMFILSVKEMYPDKNITGVFQPHLFSRTRDFCEGFAQSLDMLDAIILLDIYPARELPIEGVDAHLILNKIKTKNKMLCPKQNIVEELIARKTDVILTIGAGDIDALVEPIEKSFLNILKYI